jgi:hypothetical protein
MHRARLPVGADVTVGAIVALGARRSLTSCAAGRASGSAEDSTASAGARRPAGAAIDAVAAVKIGVDGIANCDGLPVVEAPL